MFGWFERRRLITPRTDGRHVGVSKPPERAMTGTYAMLYQYLENRYADTVVLTFAQIEDLLGFPLPDEARREREWWIDADAVDVEPRHSDAWKLARRTALPNLPAQIVAFDRA
jgi:hypothetical protein